MSDVLPQGLHAGRHGVGGVDPTTPASIGAASASDLATETATRIAQDEATLIAAKSYADSQDGVTLGSAEAYADELFESLSIALLLSPAKTASTSNVVSLSGLPTVDGVTLLAGDRVLLTAQTTASQNGPWVVAAGAWTRPIDYASGGAIPNGRTIEVLVGSSYALTTWEVTGSGSVDTAASTWTLLHATLLTTATGVVLGPAISADSTGATDLATLQAWLFAASIAAAGPVVCSLRGRDGIFQINGPLYRPWNVLLDIPGGTTIKAVGAFSSSATVLQDSPPTTVASGSNGASTSATTLNVADTTGYPSAGQVRVAISGGTAVLLYTGKTGTSFTGCTNIGATGTYATGNKVSALSYGTGVVGGGTVDANNLAQHALWGHFYAGMPIGVCCQNSLQDDIVLGDGNAVSTSFGHHLIGNAAGVLVDRTAGSMPTGYRSVWLTQWAADGDSVGQVVVKGQQTGLHLDQSSGNKIAVHPWSNGMQVCVFDDGLRNELALYADTPTQYCLRLGVNQDLGIYTGRCYLNAIYGVDNTVVAVHNDSGAKLNSIDLVVSGQDSSHRFASEYTGNFGRGSYRLRSSNCVNEFRRNVQIADATSATPAQTLVGDTSGTQDIQQVWSQNNGALLAKLGFTDYLGWLHAPAFVGAKQSGLRPSGATFETFPRNGTTIASQSALTSGDLFLIAIELPIGLLFAHVTFVSGNQAAVTPTHQWAALLDSSRALLATTTDKTTDPWGTFAAKTFDVAQVASGAASSFVTTYSGLHYVALLVTAGTVPNLQGVSPGTAVPGLAPVLYGNSDTGLTTPTAFPHTAGAITAVSALPYAYGS